MIHILRNWLSRNLSRYQRVAQTDVLDARRPELIETLNVEDVVEGRGEGRSNSKSDDSRRQQTFAVQKFQNFPNMA